MIGAPNLPASSPGLPDGRARRSDWARHAAAAADRPPGTRGSEVPRGKAGLLRTAATAAACSALSGAAVAKSRRRSRLRTRLSHHPPPTRNKGVVGRLLPFGELLRASRGLDVGRGDWPGAWPAARALMAPRGLPPLTTPQPAPSPLSDGSEEPSFTVRDATTAVEGRCAPETRGPLPLGVKGTLHGNLPRTRGPFPLHSAALDPSPRCSAGGVHFPEGKWSIPERRRVGRWHG